MNGRSKRAHLGHRAQRQVGGAGEVSAGGERGVVARGQKARHGAGACWAAAHAGRERRAETQASSERRHLFFRALAGVQKGQSNMVRGLPYAPWAGLGAQSILSPFGGRGGRQLRDGLEKGRAHRLRDVRRTTRSSGDNAVVSASPHAAATQRAGNLECGAIVGWGWRWGVVGAAWANFASTLAPHPSAHGPEAWGWRRAPLTMAESATRAFRPLHARRFDVRVTVVCAD